jgi:putative oxidoreductase
MNAPAWVALAVRYGLVVLFFPASALDKVFNFEGAVKQASEIFSPRQIAVASILAGLAIEIVMPLGVLTGFADRFAALVLAGYCAATAILFKRFWASGDFWAAGDSKGRDLFWDFLKNFSLASGFLLIVVGGDGAGLRPFLAHPFASSHPYAASIAHAS